MAIFTYYHLVPTPSAQSSIIIRTFSSVISQVPSSIDCQSVNVVKTTIIWNTSPILITSSIPGISIEKKQKRYLVIIIAIAYIKYLSTSLQRSVDKRYLSKVIQIQIIKDGLKLYAIVNIFRCRTKS